MCTGIASDVNASMMNRSKLASGSLAIVSRASPMAMSMSGWHLVMNVKFFGSLAMLMTVGSISKNFQVSPSCLWQALEPVPRPTMP